MEHHHEAAPNYIRKVQKLNQAIFYCYNASSQRVAVGMISGFVFKDQNTLLFTSNYFPVTEMNWNSFAAELHFYKKDIPESFVLHGVAVVDHSGAHSVIFTIWNADKLVDYRGQRKLLSTLFQPYISFYRKRSELILQSFKRKTTSSVFQ